MKKLSQFWPLYVVFSPTLSQAIYNSALAFTSYLCGTLRGKSLHFLRSFLGMIFPLDMCLAFSIFQYKQDLLKVFIFHESLFPISPFQLYLVRQLFVPTDVTCPQVAAANTMSSSVSSRNHLGSFPSQGSALSRVKVPCSELLGCQNTSKHTTTVL